MARGRPRKPAEQRRSEKLCAKFTPAEADALCRVAVRQRKSLSSVIHEACERMFGEPFSSVQKSDCGDSVVASLP